MSKEDTSKIGSRHVSAMARQGLAELRATVYTDSNIAQPTEYGIFGKETPGEVTDGRTDFVDAAVERLTSVVGSAVNDVRERISRSLDRESREEDRSRGLERD